MKSSVTATDRLKLVKSAGFSFAMMKDIISGWSILKTPILAPLRVPPCLMASVAALNTRMNETGPLAVPPDEPTMSFAGLNLLKEKPVPPPDWWISAVSFTASNMESRESSTGRTKQAASCCNLLPAFISAGELGRNSSPDMTLKNSPAYLSASLRFFSARAILEATLPNISSGVSITPPSGPFLRYLSPRTLSAPAERLMSMTVF